MLDKLLQSSQGKDQLSFTLQGLIVVVAGFVIIKLQASGYSINEGELSTAITNLQSFLGKAVEMLGIAITVYGSLRKVLNVKK